MKKRLIKLLLASLTGGLGMWIIAGLWHNLILPAVNENIEAHHEGIGIMLIAYLILAFMMSYIYSLIDKGEKPLMEGLRLGIIIGIVWVFPHGLAMAGAHHTSIIYEIKNTFWHIIEQGVGGIIIAAIYGKNLRSISQK